MTRVPGSSAVLTVAEMAAADRFAIAAGVPAATLMERAGGAVARAIRARHDPTDCLVLAGPGNNGGDAWVVARHLAEAGWPVRVASLVPRDALVGEAAAMARAYDGPIVAPDPASLAGAGLIVDGLFGAGLSRPLAGIAAALAEAMAARAARVVAIDMPSGLPGDTGRPLGPAARAGATVTFFRPKPGHLLWPGRDRCGALIVADIGIPEAALAAIDPATARNGADLWRDQWPHPAGDGHKYRRGHALVASGGIAATGAARLAARAALRAGAGLVSVLSPPDALAVNAAHLTAVMILPTEDAGALSTHLRDPRRNAVLLGPGNWVGARTRDMVRAALEASDGMDRALVLDADALTSFAGEPRALFEAIAGPVVLTPHEGEFRALFPDLDGRERLDRARAAAARSGAVLVLKGPDTVIADPDGRAAINANGSPYLATAGSGDVLGGLILGLLAQGMPAFAAACAGVHLHGALAEALGPGLIAEDLVEAVPQVLRRWLSDPAILGS